MIRFTGVVSKCAAGFLSHLEVKYSQVCRGGEVAGSAGVFHAVVARVGAAGVMVHARHLAFTGAPKKAPWHFTGSYLLQRRDLIKQQVHCLREFGGVLEGRPSLFNVS